jgi:hypothetical protein
MGEEAALLMEELQRAEEGTAEHAAVLRLFDGLRALLPAETLSQLEARGRGESVV